MPFEYPSRTAPAFLGQVEVLEEKVDSGLKGRFGDSLKAAHQLQELLSRQAFEERGRLRYVPDALLGFDGLGRHGKAGDPNRSSARGEDARQDLDGSALAGAVGTQQSHHLAPPQSKRYPVQNLPAPIAESQPLHAHDGIIHGVLHSSEA